MGFSLHCMHISLEEIIDAERIELTNFLKEMELQYQAKSSELCDLQQQALCFYGRWTDLHLDSLNQKQPVSGGIDHVTLSQQ